MVMKTADRIRAIRSKNPSATWAEIAAETGVSRQRVQQLATKLGLKTRPSIAAEQRAEYNCWRNMIDRCVNPNNRVFKYYGGRGICVCARWMNSFRDFFSDIGQRPSPAHSLDRIDNDDGYHPGNCRWATRTEQNNNQRGRVDRTPEKQARGPWRDLSLSPDEAVAHPDMAGWSVRVAYKKLGPRNTARGVRVGRPLKSR